MGRRRADAADDATAALARVLPGAASLTIHMCWHGGSGHGEPRTAMDAARRLRDRHGLQDGSDGDYTALTFGPSELDVEDFLAVAPFCDLAYVCDATGKVLAAVP